ncbi:VanZ family protein [bacterium]|nr:VanZ family protein [bacterium]
MSSQLSYQQSNPRRRWYRAVGLPCWRPPAYTIDRQQMRPVTKISVLGIRLAIIVLGLYWLLMFTGTHLAATTLEMADQIAPAVGDKVKHFAAFFLLGALLCYVTNSERWVKRFVSIGLVGMAYAGLDEYTQRFVPGRYPDFHDFVADAFGLWCAISAYVIAKMIYRAWASRYSQPGTSSS